MIYPRQVRVKTYNMLRGFQYNAAKRLIETTRILMPLLEKTGVHYPSNYYYDPFLPYATLQVKELINKGPYNFLMKDLLGNLSPYFYDLYDFYKFDYGFIDFDYIEQMGDDWKEDFTDNGEFELQEDLNWEVMINPWETYDISTSHDYIITEIIPEAKNRIKRRDPYISSCARYVSILTNKEEDFDFHFVEEMHYEKLLEMTFYKYFTLFRYIMEKNGKFEFAREIMDIDQLNDFHSPHMYSDCGWFFKHRRAYAYNRN